MTTGWRGLIPIAYVLMSLTGLGGLLIGDVPLAVDFPNHAARLFIECNLGDPSLSRMYSIEYSLIPNLAIDLLNQPFCGLVDPMTFLRGTLVLTMAGILLVVWKLHTHLNDRPNAFVLLAPAMTFNLVTSMGYLNYLIGTLLFLLFAWVMLRFDVLRRHRALAIALPNFFGGLIFLCHIFAVVLAGVFLFGLRLAAESGRPWLARTVRAGALTAVSFAVPLAMMFLAERSGFGFAYAIAAKIRTLWAPMIYLNIVVSGGIAVSWLVLFYWSFRERHVFIAPQLHWPVVLCLGTALLLPNGILSAADVDSRMIVSTAYLAIASLCLNGRRGSSGRAEIAAAAVAICTLALQGGVLLSRVGLFERQVAELRRGYGVIPPFSPVLSVATEERAPPLPLNMYVHLASYVTTDRKAFNPLNFTGTGMQPLQASPAFACIDVASGGTLSVPMLRGSVSTARTDVKRTPRFQYADKWDRKFDYVIFYHFGARTNPVPQHLTPVVEGSFFTIFRTGRESRSGPPCS
jgi:uncharacterized membrane protein